MDKIQAIIDIIENWSNDELVDAWNLRCDKKEDMDERIENMCFFDEMFQHLSPTEIIDKVKGCNFCTGDDYFAFNGYGNLESFTDASDYSRFSYEELAEYLVDNGDCLTTDVDTDELLESFIYEYFDHYDFDQIKSVIETYMEDNTFDLLMDDWDDLNGYILDYIEEEGLGSNDEEEEDDEDNDDEDSNDFINKLLMEEAEREKEDED